MLENPFQPDDQKRNTGQLRHFLGYALVIGGIAMSVWVFATVYSIFQEPENLAKFRQLVSSDLETTVTIAEKEGVKIVIPTEILSYGVALVLLMIALSAAATFIVGGARLLDSDIDRLSRRVRSAADRTSRKLDSLGQRLRSIK